MYAWHPYAAYYYNYMRWEYARQRMGQNPLSMQITEPMQAQSGDVEEVRAFEPSSVNVQNENVSSMVGHGDSNVTTIQTLSLSPSEESNSETSDGEESSE